MANKLSRKGLGMNAQEEEEMDKILKGMFHIISF